MAKKFYVVWQGRKPGIYNDWNSCKAQVDKFAGAKYKSFPTQAEAQAAFGGVPSAVSKSGSTKSSAVKPAKSAVSAKPNSVKTYTAAEVEVYDAKIKIFTDGGCDPNPGKAGSGMAVYDNNQISSLWYGLYNPMGTNNTAELNALYQAMLFAKDELEQGKSVVIFCDSKYSIQCITQWAAGWQKKGWKKSGGEIKNLNLIKEMFALYESLKSKLAIKHVNGHVGVEGNELADRMSILAIVEKPNDFIKYLEPIDIKAILAMQAG